MRIFRDHDGDDHDDEQSRKGINRDEIAAHAEVMYDEIADYLADPAAYDTNLDETIARSPAKPILRLVPPLPTPQPSTTATPAESGDPAPVLPTKPPTRGQIWRASAAGSFVVVGLATTAAWGQSAEVGAPVVLYGLGWIAYLAWNAARRPSPSLALATFTEHRAARAQQPGLH
ncbi:hypothetical protein ACIRRA_30725 [Nocardia sp. NPDC101769]|uniref:hypothetical protein n=1 Tax=Nocardia sp. NPDC101769 TaxID=3364333 RepID=UPI00380B0067